MKDMFRALALVTEIGLVLVICIGGGLLFGLFLDRKLGTKALFTIFFIFAGIASGFLTVYKMIFSGEKN